MVLGARGPFAAELLCSSDAARRLSFCFALTLSRCAFLHLHCAFCKDIPGALHPYSDPNHRKVVQLLSLAKRHRHTNTAQPNTHVHSIMGLDLPAILQLRVRQVHPQLKLVCPYASSKPKVQKTCSRLQSKPVPLTDYLV